MNCELICSWLGLPADAWPPDHYRLLGLEPGEGDVALIEQRVHQRLDSVRRYQMMYPEQATEAMNRLAKAFIELTEAATKLAYDQSLMGNRAVASAPPSPPLAAPVVAAAAPLAVSVVAAAPSPMVPRDPLVWLYTPGPGGPGGETPPPPPVRLPTAPAVMMLTPPVPAERATPPPPPLPAAPPAPPIDTVVESARTSPAVKRGLTTKRALYHRVARTRQLLRLWHRIGKHFVDTERRLSKQEASDLYKRVKEFADVLDDFPLLGEAGQPGYLIINLMQLDKARALQGLTTSQRESLQRDWKVGLKFLEAHRDYLRGELRANRKRGWTERTIRAVRGYINEEPLAAGLLLLALVSLAIAVWRSYL
jgi:hypothetical protein